MRIENQARAVSWGRSRLQRYQQLDDRDIDDRESVLKYRHTYTKGAEIDIKYQRFCYVLNESN